MGKVIDPLIDAMPEINRNYVFHTQGHESWSIQDIGLYEWEISYWVNVNRTSAFGNIETSRTVSNSYRYLLIIGDGTCFES